MNPYEQMTIRPTPDVERIMGHVAKRTAEAMQASHKSMQQRMLPADESSVLVAVAALTPVLGRMTFAMGAKRPPTELETQQLVSHVILACHQFSEITKAEPKPSEKKGNEDPSKP